VWSEAGDDGQESGSVPGSGSCGIGADGQRCSSQPSPTVGRRSLDASSLLETTAEVSVAFTGFIGIFLVLAARDGRFPPGDSFQIRLIVICSIAPVFFAVLPLVLNALGLSEPMLWRVSSSTIALSGVAIVAYMVRTMRSLSPGEGRSLNYGFLLGLVASLSCIANAFGWPWAPTAGLYLLTVWSIVGIAGGNFVELLFRKLL
jgi:hypothetical protein